jgi:hypothetical protein
MPSAKFTVLPCNAKPIAKPATPRMAIKPVIYKPKIEKTSNISSINNRFFLLKYLRK